MKSSLVHFSESSERVFAAPVSSVFVVCALPPTSDSLLTALVSSVLAVCVPDTASGSVSAVPAKAGTGNVSVTTSTNESKIFFMILLSFFT